jgi:hypothetical protein
MQRVKTKKKSSALSLCPFVPRRLSHAAFLVFLAAAARAGVVAAYSGRRIRSGGGAAWRLPLGDLLLAKSGEFVEKRAAVGKEAFEPCTQVI